MLILEERERNFRSTFFPRAIYTPLISLLTHLSSRGSLTRAPILSFGRGRLACPFFWWPHDMLSNLPLRHPKATSFWAPTSTSYVWIDTLWFSLFPLHAVTGNGLKQSPAAVKSTKAPWVWISSIKWFNKWATSGYHQIEHLSCFSAKGKGKWKLFCLR